MVGGASSRACPRKETCPVLADKHQREEENMSICERKKELKRRRHRRKKMVHFVKRLKKSTVSEHSVIVEKIRNLTPGDEQIIVAMGLEER